MTTDAPTVADVRSGEMAASKTHKVRRWCFIPAADPTAVQLGTLTVIQGKEIVTYLVGIEGGEIYFARQDSEAEVYGVRLVSGTATGCTCTGWRFKGTCKHMDCTRAMLAERIVS